MKQVIATLTLFLLTVCGFGQQTEKVLTYFGFGKYEVTQQSKVTLDNLFEKVKSKDIIQIEISGHTDSDGDESYNYKLSQRRAATVRQYFISRGISTDKIKSNYFGEIQPAATNDNEAGKQQNRRVEITIKYKERIEFRQITKTEINKDLAIDDKARKIFKQYFSVNREYIQTFQVSPKRENVIKGEKGTTIRIPENAFVDANGVTVANKVTIELLEIYTKSDMILNNIQTTSNQKLLETGGMIYIRAISRNTDVDLKKDEFLTIEFPTKHKQKGMNIFYGDTTNRDINWQQADRNFWRDGTYLQNLDELNKYIFNSTELGWINCDRFINQTETTDLIVNTTDTTDVNFCLVFKSINSVMNVSDRRNKIKFYNVPVGQTATLVAFKRTGQETFYASKTVTLQKNQSVEIALQKLSDNEFKAIIRQFD